MTPDATGFYLYDAAPTPTPEPPIKPEPESSPAPVAKDFDAMRQSLRAGVQVAVVPQLFPTPAELADEMVKTLELGYTFADEIRHSPGGVYPDAALPPEMIEAIVDVCSRAGDSRDPAFNPEHDWEHQDAPDGMSTFRTCRRCRKCEEI